MATRHPANQARAAQKRPTPKGKAAHTSSTSPTAKPAATSSKGRDATRGEETRGRRGNPWGWPLVEILWIDAISDGLWEWLDPDDLQHMAPEDSLVVGYLAHQTDEYVTVASLINDDSVAHAMCIPRSLIVTLRHLEGP